MELLQYHNFYNNFISWKALEGKEYKRILFVDFMERIYNFLSYFLKTFSTTGGKKTQTKNNPRIFYYYYDAIVFESSKATVSLKTHSTNSLNCHQSKLKKSLRPQLVVNNWWWKHFALHRVLRRRGWNFSSYRNSFFLYKKRKILQQQHNIFATRCG